MASPDRRSSASTDSVWSAPESSAPTPPSASRPGTPENAHAISSSGLMHFVCGGIGFFGLIAACLVFARRFWRNRQAGWAAYSAITGVLFLAGFFAIATGSQKGPATVAAVNIAFSLVVVLAWSWISMLAMYLKPSDRR